MSKPKRKRVLHAKYGLKPVIDLNKPVDEPVQQGKPVEEIDQIDNLAAELSTTEEQLVDTNIANMNEAFEAYRKFAAKRASLDKAVRRHSDNIAEQVKAIILSSLHEDLLAGSFNYLSEMYGRVYRYTPEKLDVTVRHCNERHQRTRSFYSKNSPMNTTPADRACDMLESINVYVDGCAVGGYTFSSGVDLSREDDHQKRGERFADWLRRAANFCGKIDRNQFSKIHDTPLTDMPEDSHYPIKRNIKAWLRGLGINARNDSREIDYDCCGTGEDDSPVSRFHVVGPSAGSSDLREYVRYNQNMVKVEEYLTKRNLLAKRDDVDDGDMTRVTFHLKLVKPR